MNKTKIKICGLKSEKDIEMVNRYRPDFCGFIIDFPKSHRSLEPERVSELSRLIDREHMTAVGVFVNESIEQVAELLNDGTIDVAQLHGNETADYIAQLRSLTDKKLIKAFAVKDKASLNAAAACTADYILLDQGQGSGETFDWSILGSRDAEEAFGSGGLPKKEWFLAGGLGEHNIEQAIQRFKPFAVDLSSAVETDRCKDETKVKKIIELVRNCRMA